MKIYVYLLIVICIACQKPAKHIYITKYNFSYTLIRPNIRTIDSLELQQSGIRIYKPFDINLSDSYFPNSKKYKFAQPLLYLRKNENMNTVVSYFFTEKDSIVRLVEYAWNTMKDGDSISELYKYNEEYFNQYFKNQAKHKSEVHPGWKQKMTTWENDSINIFHFILSHDEPERTRVIIRFK
ncbi:MAG: hypothetical protein CFE23_16635 [Flavobacterium sp. BFFFF1]|uniref:hypothetical protein n=1 Tax=Flavobacterium sp. BFFFF1 TaxID=2015557 RepID=UPI000BCE44D0|nr:hypothetical protein [Flavobacterium sp. BFFFF1]OYU78860.1 MAG: hypothetical protein CFE23_16635 [Flavobacterium sp. BFFFF1]